MIFLATRDSLSKIDNKGMDAITLFAYLKLVQTISPLCLLLLELPSNNMSVLNAIYGQESTPTRAGREDSKAASEKEYFTPTKRHV